MRSKPDGLSGEGGSNRLLKEFQDSPTDGRNQNRCDAGGNEATHTDLP